MGLCISVDDDAFLIMQCSHVSNSAKLNARQTAQSVLFYVYTIQGHECFHVWLWMTDFWETIEKLTFCT